MKKIFALAVLAIGVLSVAFLAGCHTWHGFGQDVSQTGNAIENSSEK